MRVDKCSTFGIRKLCTKSVQYLPKLLINGIIIPCVEMGESFRYSGRFFDFNISKRVSMGLTDRRKTAKNLADSRKNWKILTVSRN